MPHKPHKLSQQKSAEHMSALLVCLGLNAKIQSLIRFYSLEEVDRVTSTLRVTRCLWFVFFLAFLSRLSQRFFCALRSLCAALRPVDLGPVPFALGGLL